MHVPKSPSVNQQAVSWESIDEQIISDITGINSHGGEIVLLTSTINSPSTLKLINEFGGRFKNFNGYNTILFHILLLLKLILPASAEP